MGKLTVIKTGGKQYLVSKGDILSIEKIDGNIGDEIFFKDVLLLAYLDKKKTAIGKPFLKVSVGAKILSQSKGKKVKIIKYKPKTRYHKKQGHRQLYTKIKIIKILEQEKPKRKKKVDIPKVKKIKG